MNDVRHRATELGRPVLRPLGGKVVKLEVNPAELRAMSELLGWLGLES